MADSFEHKVALVTGGGSGIGRATALAFGREGARVAVSDVNAEGGGETVGMIEDAGGKAMFIRADVSKASDAESLVDQTVRAYGGLNCAFNNAGISGATGETHEFPEDEWDRVIDVNLKGVWLCMKYEIRHMLSQGGGAVVNTSSIAGLVGGATPAYNASKHGVIGLTKQAALEYARRGIRVSAICPSIIRTPLLEDVFVRWPEAEAKWIEAQPNGRFGSPEEVTGAVLWLCSDGSSFVTGHAMPVDGGWLALLSQPLSVRAL